MAQAAGQGQVSYWDDLTWPRTLADTKARYAQRDDRSHGPSVRGEKTFWIPFARSPLRYQELNEYRVDIMMVATAFVRAENADIAAALFEKTDQLSVDFEARGIWFFPEGLIGSSFPIVLSPMMAMVGPVEGSELSLEDEDGKTSKQIPGMPISRSASPAGRTPRL